MFSERYNDMNGNKKNDWLPYTIAAGLAVAIAIDVWLFCMGSVFERGRRSWRLTLIRSDTCEYLRG
jgi:hypothetical protein